MKGKSIARLFDGFRRPNRPLQIKARASWIAIVHVINNGTHVRINMSSGINGKCYQLWVLLMYFICIILVFHTVIQMYFILSYICITVKEGLI